MNEYQKYQITRFMHMQILELNSLMITLGCPIKVTYNITETEDLENLEEWTKFFAVPFEMPSKKDQNASEDLQGDTYISETGVIVSKNPPSEK